jgi:hypothetical protein
VGYAKQAIRDKQIEHKRFTVQHGCDMPELVDWKRANPRRKTMTDGCRKAGQGLSKSLPRRWRDEETGQSYRYYIHCCDKMTRTSPM